MLDIATAKPTKTDSTKKIKAPVKVKAPRVKAPKVKAPRVKAPHVSSSAAKLLGLVQSPHPLLSGR